MKLEQQVCSLELSKRLKELGVKHESLFLYVEMPWILEGESGKILETRTFLKINAIHFVDFNSILDNWNAFTVAELGEMLPASLAPASGSQAERPILMQKTSENKYFTYGQLPNGTTNPIFCGNTEADARAKMLIYLIENKLMELPNEI